MLGADDRRPPTRLPLRLAARDLFGIALEERLVRRVPVRAFPPSRLVKPRAECALTLVEGRDADRTVGFPLLHRVDDPVDLVEALRCPGGHVGTRLLRVVEAGDVRLVDVDLRRVAAHPLGDGPRDPGTFFDPARRDRPQPVGLRALAQHGMPVGGHRDQAVDRVPHTDALVVEHVGHQLERLGELGVEVLLGERELGRRKRRLLDRWDVVGFDEDRAVRVGADFQVRTVLTFVHQRVHVPHDRELDLARGLREHRDRSDADHLVHGRYECDARPGHPRDAWLHTPQQMAT